MKNFLLLILLAALWGPSFLFIKVAVAEIPPITLILSRVAIAAVFLYLLLRLQKRHLPPLGRTWGHMSFMALFHIAIPFVLLSWAEQYIDSASASILNGMTPIFTILLAHFLTADDKLSAVKVVGITLGLMGTAMLVAPSLVTGFEATTMGLLAVVVVAAFYGMAMVYARKNMRGMEPLVAPTGQMILATLFLIPFALLIDRPFSLPTPSLQAIGAVLAMAILGTVLAFIVYYSLVDRADASYTSMVTYLIPIAGIFLGLLVLGERLTWNTYAGFGLILGGVMIVNGGIQGLGSPRLWPARLRSLAGTTADQ